MGGTQIMITKIIDNTKPKDQDIIEGEILKCWNDDPKEFNVYKIMRANYSDYQYDLDELGNGTGIHLHLMNNGFDSTEELMHRLHKDFANVQPVQAILSIQN